MAYRAPELFDVKTGLDLDEKVDIWVRKRSKISNFLRLIWSTVAGMHSVCPGIFTFSIRKYPNNRAGRIHSYGCAKCTV